MPTRRAGLHRRSPIFGHIFLTRLRPGWHITAIGGSRRSAYNSGIPVRRTIALCYVASGVLTSIGALFFAARLGTVGGDIGVGLEVIVLTATVLGGISLGGGKGSVAKPLVGTLIVLLITNGLTTMIARGGVNRMALAGDPAASAAMIDIRWLKNRTRIVSKVYVSPTYHALPPPPPTEIGQRRRRSSRTTSCATSTLIGLGRIEAPEDVILDRHDNLYAGSRHGDIIRFFPPDYERMEVFAHIGGQPLGMAFDQQDNLYVCIGGMGLYRITPDGKVEKATDETNRSLLLGQRRQPPAARRRSRHHRRRPHLLLRGHRALRDARVADRRAGGARQRPHHLLRHQDRQDAHRAARPQISRTASASPATGSRSCSPRPGAARSSATGSTGPKKGTVEIVHGQSAGLSRQHQPRLRRQLLAGAGRHAQPVARSRLEDAGLPPAHGQARAARRMAVPQHQHRLRASSSTSRARSWRSLWDLDGDQPSR